MNRIINAQIVLIAPAVLLFSCSKNLSLLEETTVSSLPFETVRHSLDSLSNRRPSTFYAKYDSDYDAKKQHVSFKTSLRSVKDSAMNASISFAAIPVANALITPDSLKLVNRQGNCYLVQTLSYFRENFGIDFTLTNLEELFLGMPLKYNASSTYVQISEGSNVLSTHTNEAIKQMRANEKGLTRNDVVIQYVFSPDGKQLDGLLLESIMDKTTAKVSYLKREVTEGFSFPTEIVLTIQSPKNFITLILVAEKKELNQPQEIHFVIPEGYGLCK
jgi:hypothetical protein